MSPAEKNADAPDPHAAYRLEVEAAEDLALAQAMVVHYRQRAYGMHLEVRARDARIAELEATTARLVARLEESGNPET